MKEQQFHRMDSAYECIAIFLGKLSMNTAISPEKQYPSTYSYFTR